MPTFELQHYRDENHRTVVIVPGIVRIRREYGDQPICKFYPVVETIEGLDALVKYSGWNILSIRSDDHGVVVNGDIIAPENQRFVLTDIEKNPIF